MTKTSFFNLIDPGMTMQLGQYTFEKEEIIRFADKFDPQKFHLSEDGAKTSIFGNLCASGWHTASIWMRQNVIHGRDELIRLTKYTGPEPEFGPSPGVRNLRWVSPVFVGDTITYQSTIIGKRELPKHPGWGLVTSHSQGINQNEKPVLALNGAVFVKLD